MSYTVRASEPLSVLHIAAQTATRCGLPMTPAGLWMTVDKRPGAVVCTSCEAEQQLAALAAGEYEQPELELTDDDAPRNAPRNASRMGEVDHG